MPHISPKRRKPVKRYSTSLPADKQEKVLRIQAQKGDEFTTRVFASSIDSNEIQWRESRKDEKGLWTVWQMTSKPGVFQDERGDTYTEEALQQVQRFSGACFFDALYDCATFEVGELSRGITPGVSLALDEEELRHYRDFAGDQGIVFDKNTHMPLAVADGMVLAERCTLDQNARAVVKKSRGNLLPSTTRKAMQLGDILGDNDNRTLSVLPGSSPENALAVMDQSVAWVGNQNSVEKSYAKRKKSLKRLSGSFDLAANNNCKEVVLRKETLDYFLIPIIGYASILSATTGMFLSGGLAWLPYTLSGVGGLIAGVGLCAAWSDYGKTPVDVFRENGPTMPHRAFRKDLSRVRRQVKGLPDGEEKTLSQEFLKRAEVTFAALSTRHAFKKAVDGGLWAKANMKWERRSLLRVARKHGMEDSAITALLSALQNDPHSCAFEDKIEEQFNQDVKSFRSLLEKSETNDLAQLKRLGPAVTMVG